MTPEQLKTQIRLAFVPRAYFGPITACSCEECTAIREKLRHQCWDHIPAEFIDFTGSPTLLEPAAFAAFVPAYMVRALDSGQASVVLEFTVYSLCPSYRDDDNEQADIEDQHRMPSLRQRAQAMNAPQIDAIRSFLMYVREALDSDGGFAPIITAALEYVWR